MAKEIDDKKKKKKNKVKAKDVLKKIAVWLMLIAMIVGFFSVLMVLFIFSIFSFLVVTRLVPFK